MESRSRPTTVSTVSILGSHPDRKRQTVLHGKYALALPLRPNGLNQLDPHTGFVSVGNSALSPENHVSEVDHPCE